MTLKDAPDLHAFLAQTFSDIDSEQDDGAAREFCTGASADKLSRIVAQGRRLADQADLPVDEFGSEANRWFADSGEARAWLVRVIAILEQASGGENAGSDVVVKDSNGAVLSEGDSVQVIKDLKVKGGSSDLKRGTLIKKIHLVGDPDVIECRVDGSTLVLKTCFLKKA